MIAKHPDQRVGVFVDVSNMYYSAKNIYGRKVNFGAVLRTAVGKRKLIRAIAYVIEAGELGEEAFFKALSKEGFEVRIKELQVFPGGIKKGDWDVGIAIDMIRLSQKLDAVVLVSGDGDFLPLVEYLKNQGQQVELVAFGKSASAKLIESCDDFIDLDRNPKRYLL